MCYCIEYKSSLQRCDSCRFCYDPSVQKQREASIAYTTAEGFQVISDFPLGVVASNELN